MEHLGARRGWSRNRSQSRLLYVALVVPVFQGTWTEPEVGWTGRLPLCSLRLVAARAWGPLLQSCERRVPLVRRLWRWRARLPTSLRQALKPVRGVSCSLLAPSLTSRKSQQGEEVELAISWTTVWQN